MPFTALVTGANRGIGLELTRLLISGPPRSEHVFATCRNMEECQDLKALEKDNDNLHILQLDVTDQSSYQRVVGQVSAVVKSCGLNLLVNNAGATCRHPLADVTADEMLSIFNINCVAPLVLTQAFLPLLRAGSAAVGGDVMSYRRAAIVMVTSKMGSLADNGSGGGYEYRASKAALNAITRSLGIDLKPEQILAVAMHPGWVRTRMGTSRGLIDPDECAQNMMASIVKLSDKDTSMFIDRFGEPIPW